MSDDDQVWAMRIDRLKDGGFMVGPIGNNGNLVMFACTEINDAVRYIVRNLCPPQLVAEAGDVNSAKLGAVLGVKRAK